MKSVRVFLPVLLLLSVVPLLTASIRDVQIYAIVERVVFEPHERTPERIKVYGAFAFLYTNQEPFVNGDGPYAPHKGYLYFKLPDSRRDPQKSLQLAARREWADLKAVASTGQAVMFGSWSSGYLGLARNSRDKSGFVSATDSSQVLRVNTERTRDVDPIPYTMDAGVVKMPNHGNFAVLAQQLQNALKQ